MDIIQTPARELGESAQHVENVVRLLDEGNTLPFIARYCRLLLATEQYHRKREIATTLSPRVCLCCLLRGGMVK